MFLVRWFSIVLVVIAVMLLGADLVSTLEMKTMVVRSLDQVLILFGFDVKRAVLANGASPVADATLYITGFPAWLMFGFLGFVFSQPTPKTTRPLPAPPPISR
jgi:hypothetical protein